MNDLLVWECWLVECPESAPQVIIEAPSKGVAIEFYMASHGLLSTDTVIRCELTDRPLYGSKEDVIQTLSGVDAMKVRELDAHHSALLALQRRYAVTRDVLDASYKGFTHGPFDTIKQGLDVEPEHSLAVLCEVHPEKPTIIKHYWDLDRGWVVAGNLALLVNDEGDENSPIRYGFPGVFELDGVPLLPFMRAHDSIVDNGGQGRTVYVHRCAQCGRLIARNTMVFVPLFCGKCKAGEWIQRKITL